ncbi:hypothetical protein BJ878DRAFT_523059 [Calycina marina]|uniref:Uncharacterized protein n=1 Tax=Calycina marina TaxID=1763456 RepID=A0A9P8CBH5_9HELO|nr:hypothetical protein BJ878DRAFT_523059 [Calycina marina]
MNEGKGSDSEKNKVFHPDPVAFISESSLKAPPLDSADPSPVHSFLPIPAASAAHSSVRVYESCCQRR